MAPLAASLARSESKAKFLIRIGLDENNKVHRHLYSKMKAEASEGWQRMTKNRDALVDNLKHDQTVEPPYTYGQIKESAMRFEVARIYEMSCPETRIMYNLAHDEEDAVVEENWIIRWLLWHVFRYRDDRNGVVHRQRTHFQAVAFRPRPEHTHTHTLTLTHPHTQTQDMPKCPLSQLILPPSPSPLPLPPPSQLVAAAATAVTAGTSTPAHKHAGSPARYWDPVRDVFRDIAANDKAVVR